MACRLAETAGIYIFFDGYFSLSPLKSELKSVSHHNSTYVKLDIHSNKVWFTQFMWHNMMLLFICFMLQHPFFVSEIGDRFPEIPGIWLMIVRFQSRQCSNFIMKYYFPLVAFLRFSLESDVKSAKLWMI